MAARLTFAVRCFAWAGAAAVLAAPLMSPGGPVSLVRVAVEQPTSLTISGSVEGLRDATPAKLTLTLTSRADSATVVRSVEVRVTGASAGCPRTALAARSWSGQLTVPAHGRAAVVVRVELRDPHGACTGSTWRLAYTSA